MTSACDGAIGATGIACDAEIPARPRPSERSDAASSFMDVTPFLGWASRAVKARNVTRASLRSRSPVAAAPVATAPVAATPTPVTAAPAPMAAAPTPVPTAPAPMAAAPAPVTAAPAPVTAAPAHFLRLQAVDLVA